ncbi:DUF4350 domain-containing protein [Novosphingobium sp. 9U]|uniref:DUF4350 domain-containing protein n=1 Tax=Novosphingobium sp. 9U TaxID=2653158 RepID=UPI0012F362A7|nr:DUF4350 domain-containing protein [Novosphingobium sp. 9U]VWX53457.1 conserved hypothetical protein [Novosphingobium sp. 9U]
MSEAAMSPVGANPFTVRTALMLVLFGCVVFVALLWMIGNGLADGDANNGGAHAEGRGLNGFAALADLVERRGATVRRSRSKAAFDGPGLLVLTPAVHAKARDIEEAIGRHRHLGPTLLVLPKWLAFPVPAQVAAAGKAKPGWVMVAGGQSPEWADELASLGSLDVRIEQRSADDRGWRWNGLGRSGRLPAKAPEQSLSSGAIAALVRDARGQTLAGYLDDGSAPPRLSGRACEAEAPAYPLLVVAEPDLLDNYALADRDRALLALELIARARDGGDEPVTFDLTLAGLERKANLLTLAFTPPFLAATLCLLLAAATTGWRAFLRFGPPLAPSRSIAFGKRALVSNAAALIVRSRRLHLLGGPYAEAARQRLARAFALPRTGDAAAEAAALDRAARAAGRGDHAFSQAAARLGQARSERELVKAAADLHALERTLTR